MLAEREKFHAVIQDLSHGIIITDGQWKIQTISRRAAELLARPDEDLTGHDLAEVLSRFQVEPSLEALRQSQAHAVTIDLTQENVRPPRYLAGRYTRIEGPHGELFNAAMVFRDISEMRQKEKLKRDFLSLITHKLKTPLTIVGGYLRLIDQRKYGDVPPAMAEAVKISMGKVQELGDLIEKVLSYAGLTATELERAGRLVSVEDVVRRISRRLQERYPARQTDWVIALAPGLPRARAPEELLFIVLDNLMDNAVKFCPRSAVRVEVSAREVEDRQLEISVRDDGPGIRPLDRDQVFQDFTQFEDVFTGNIAGMGLGLATAKRLVAGWGGQIDFESTVGEGSRFFFTVPSEFTPARDAPDRAV
jgi:two-component system phosphate regulon sensor histidine kinase PhoR